MQHGLSRWTASRAWRLLAAASVAAMVIARADAWAQHLRPHPSPAAACAHARARQAAIDCGAAVGDRNTCEADTSSGVVLVRQSGEGNCVLGRTWGFDAKGVWVADGCRGTFAFTDDRVTVACSAAAGAREVCQANTAAGVALVSGSPACVLGRTWGYDQDGIWVSDGCQATFVLTTRGALECGSDGARQHCAADTSAGVVLARSTATAPCVLGESWGYDATGVWVDKGCRAEFVLGNPDPGGPENKDLYDFFGLFEPYGRLRGHVALFNDEIEVQDDASLPRSELFDARRGEVLRDDRVGCQPRARRAGVQCRRDHQWWRLSQRWRIRRRIRCSVTGSVTSASTSGRSVASPSASSGGFTPTSRCTRRTSSSCSAVRPARHTPRAPTAASWAPAALTRR